MRIAPVAEVKAHLSSYLEQSKEGPIIITKSGRPVAVLVSAPEGDELERLVLAYTPKFRQLLDAAEQRIQQTGGIMHEDFWESVESAGEQRSGEAGESD